MLEPEDSDIHDSGRHLHSGLPFLRNQNGPSPCSRRRGATTGGRKRRTDETAVCRRNFRDDLPDGGAAHWAATVEAIRTQNPDAVIELLIPDLDARPDLLEVIVASKPDIIGHNIETVERLTPVVRSRAKYRTSLETLRCLNRQGVVTKSGLMVGLGESDDEVLQTLHDLRDAGVRIVTLGQYLRPTLEHYPVAAYITPEKFEWYRLRALEMGFSYCASAPLVRSSYMAEEALRSVKSL